jgi:hypothetical protein
MSLSKNPKKWPNIYFASTQKITLQTFGITETLVFMFLCDHITYIFIIIVFIVFDHFDHVWIMVYATVQYFIDHAQPVILSSTSNVESQ